MIFYEFVCFLTSVTIHVGLYQNGNVLLVRRRP